MEKGSGKTCIFTVAESSEVRTLMNRWFSEKNSSAFSNQAIFL